MNGRGAALPATEAAARARDLDMLGTVAIVALLAREQTAAAEAVARATPAIAAAVDAIALRLRAGGTLHYVGAGTSGRLAMLDAAECPPTFGTPPSLVVAHVAGGAAALVRAIEGAEDDAAAGTREMNAITAGDAVVGISASGGAPYVIAAVRAARAAGALTVGVASDPRAPLVTEAELAIVLETGAEPVAGSTRLKAGTAQKLVLNALSTGAMIRLGKVHDNLMVDVVATNAKLRARAVRFVTALAAVDEARARTLLDEAQGSVKVAVVMGCRALDARGARAALAEHDGFLRPLLDLE